MVPLRTPIISTVTVEPNSPKSSGSAAPTHVPKTAHRDILHGTDPSSSRRNKRVLVIGHLVNAICLTPCAWKQAYAAWLPFVSVL